MTISEIVGREAPASLEIGRCLERRLQLDPCGVGVGGGAPRRSAPLAEDQEPGRDSPDVSVFEPEAHELRLYE